jgi:hypothetical protein
MLIYGAGMALSIVLPAKRAVAPVAIIAGAVALVWALVLVAHVWGIIELGDLWKKMSEKGGAVEEGREAGGLLIEAVWLVAGGAFRRVRA